MRRPNKTAALIDEDMRPLTNAELAGFRHQINSRLLRRFIVTIDELNRQLSERDQQLQRFDHGAKQHARR
jgi:hypothetical protein